MKRRILLQAVAAVGLLAAFAAGAADAATKRVMVYGDSNSWGWIPVANGFPSTRYEEAKRWPGVLQAAWGSDYEVIDEGLSARTTDLADPTLPQIGGAGLDGSAYLPAALASHLPLDLVVIMLGTNDLKAMYARSPLRIALGMGKLVDIVASTKGGVGTTYGAPKVLVLAPLGPQSVFKEMFEGGVEKLRALAPLYEDIAEAADAEFLDVGQVTKTDGSDGIHFTEAGQKAIGLAVAEKVKTILN